MNRLIMAVIVCLMMNGCASTTVQNLCPKIPDPPTMALEPVPLMEDIKLGPTKAQALKALVRNNIKGQEALDKLYSWQRWYKEQKEKEYEMGR